MSESEGETRNSIDAAVDSASSTALHAPWFYAFSATTEIPCSIPSSRSQPALEIAAVPQTQQALQEKSSPPAVTAPIPEVKPSATWKYVLVAFIVAFPPALFNWTSRNVRGPQDPLPPTPPPVEARVTYASRIVPDAADGKPFIVQIGGDPKQVARGVAFCIEAESEVESLGEPSYDNSPVEINKIMRVERERVTPTGDCYKVARIGRQQTLTIRYPAKLKSPAAPQLKLKNFGDGYLFEEISGPRGAIERPYQRPRSGVATKSTAANSTRRARAPRETCAFSIRPAASSISNGSNCGVVSVSAPEGCSWTVAERIDWITVASSAMGSGNGTVSFQVAANSTASSRTGTVSIAGQLISFTQDGVQWAATVVFGGDAASTVSYPAGQARGAVFVTVGHLLQQAPRHGIDLASHTQLVLEIRGAAGSGSVEVGTKTSAQLDYGSEAKVFTDDGTFGGVTDDTPLVGDFDGDGKSDITVYRRSTGIWYIPNSRGLTQNSVPSTSAGCMGTRFGAENDIPVTGDFDGDGRSDLVFYPGGQWITRPSAGGMNSGIAPRAVNGSEQHYALAGDFNGDGRADLYFFWPGSGDRRFFPSSGNGTVIPADNTSDKPGYEVHARTKNSSSVKCGPQDQSETTLRPLRVRMLDNGGAHLKVTSEVDPTAVCEQFFQEQRFDGNPPLRPLRVKMLDNGGANLKVTSKVDATAAYEEQRLRAATLHNRCRMALNAICRHFARYLT